MKDLRGRVGTDEVGGWAPAVDEMDVSFIWVYSSLHAAHDQDIGNNRNQDEQPLCGLLPKWRNAYQE